MKPTKDNLKEEIKYRMSCLEGVMKEQDDELLYKIFANEHSMLSEILELINVFGNRIGYRYFDLSRYTPLFCQKTNEPLLIGDKVEDNRGRCGLLQFDDYTKKYVIKAIEGGHIHATDFTKITDLYDYNIDAERVECRTPGKYLKRRW